MEDLLLAPIVLLSLFFIALLFYSDKDQDSPLLLILALTSLLLPGVALAEASEGQLLGAGAALVSFFLIATVFLLRGQGKGLLPPPLLFAAILSLFSAIAL